MCTNVYNKRNFWEWDVYIMTFPATFWWTCRLPSSLGIYLDD